MLRTDARGGELDPCSSGEWSRCPWAARKKTSASPVGGGCPFLRTSEVLYCHAAPETRFVPYSDSLTSYCQAEGHEYCDLFLSRARPPRPDGAGTAAGDEEGAPTVQGIAVPKHLAYAANHLWLDLREDDSCHLGVDAFLARALGDVEGVEFVETRGLCRPTAVLTVRGAELLLTFPNPIHLTRTNPTVRFEPERIVDDPYGRGWLFSGRESWDADGPPRARTTRGLRSGDDAVAWMREECARLTRFAQESSGRTGPGGVPVMNDGGVVAPGIASHLDRGDFLRLVHRFFSGETTARIV
jgi:glycine cleavage system H lipoate-binding protein